MATRAMRPHAFPCTPGGGAGGPHGPSSEPPRWPDPNKLPKEFEKLELPTWKGLPGIDRWLRDARNVVAVCANRGEYPPWVDWWFSQLEDPTRTPEDFKVVVPTTYTLDIKLFDATMKIAKAADKPVADRIDDLAAEYKAETGRRLPGRYALKVLLDSTKVDEDSGFLYRIWS